MAIIYVDSAVRFSVVIKDSAGTLVDPTTLQFTLINPAGIGTTYVYLTDSELIKDSTGNFHIDLIILVLDGDWKWKWKSTGTGAGAAVGTFAVKE